MDFKLISISVIVVLFIAIFASGYRLKQTGKPYNTITFNIHKLIGLAVMAILIVKLYKMNQVSDIGWSEWITCTIAGLLFLSAIISGGVLSIDKQMPDIVIKIHRVNAYLIIPIIAIIYYQLI